MKKPFFVRHREDSLQFKVKFNIWNCELMCPRNEAIYINIYIRMV